MKKPASLIGNKNKFLILGCGYSGSYFAKTIKKIGEELLILFQIPFLKIKLAKVVTLIQG